MAVLTLDAGHGGKDPGTYHRKFHHLPTESQIVLDVTKKLGKLLSAEGHRVLYTRLEDKYLSVGERVKIANRNKSNLFISIHCNGVENPQANGFEVVHDARSHRSEYLSKLILGHIQEEFPRLKNRGNKPSPSSIYPRKIYVVRGTKMPGALVELAFLTNDTEATILASEKMHDKFASAIARGVCEYCDAHL